MTAAELRAREQHLTQCEALYLKELGAAHLELAATVDRASALLAADCERFRTVGTAGGSEADLAEITARTELLGCVIARHRLILGAAQAHLFAARYLLEKQETRTRGQNGQQDEVDPPASHARDGHDGARGD